MQNFASAKSSQEFKVVRELPRSYRDMLTHSEVSDVEGRLQPSGPNGDAVLASKRQTSLIKQFKQTKPPRNKLS